MRKPALQSKFHSVEEDLRNEEIVASILENGTPEELESLRLFYKLTPEQIELWRKLAKLRGRTHRRMEKEAKKRIEENPLTTKEELSLGTYKEWIELQVRETVFNLRRKGYTTYQSGFSDLGREQRISFEKNHLKNFQLPKELIRQLERKGVSLKIEPDSISFKLNRYLKLNEIKEIWGRIERNLPDLKQPVEPCKTSAADFFRKQQEKFWG